MIFEVEYNTITCLLRTENSESDLHFNLTKYICYRNCSWQKKTGEWSVGRVGNIPGFFCFLFFFNFISADFKLVKITATVRRGQGRFFPPLKTPATWQVLSLSSIVVPDPMRFCWASRCPRNGSHQFGGYVLTQFG